MAFAPGTSYISQEISLISTKLVGIIYVFQAERWEWWAPMEGLEKVQGKLDMRTDNKWAKMRGRLFLSWPSRLPQALKKKQLIKQEQQEVFETLVYCLGGVSTACPSLGPIWAMEQSAIQDIPMSIPDIQLCRRAYFLLAGFESTNIRGHIGSWTTSVGIVSLLQKFLVHVPLVSNCFACFMHLNTFSVISLEGRRMHGYVWSMSCQMCFLVSRLSRREKRRKDQSNIRDNIP